ncbi:MAG: riboflavin biosynthesis protein RibF [Candidatus Neomarinimicrobiota bacterium]|nr:MAG: riboflavin biosynthesis protein RibF [Candidatus Neomarinimicrobiota bacterium]
MEVIRSLEQITPLDESVVTMGSFDGLHRGHQQIIRMAVSHSHVLHTPACVVTYHPHPRHILEPDQPKLPLIMSLDQKLALLEQLGVERTLVIPFDREFSRWSAQKFLDELLWKYFHPQHVIIGYDHHFGWGREGSPEFLRNYCRQKDIRLEVVAPVSDQGIHISSSHIRTLLQEGYVRRASFELGWVFGFQARVVHGSGRGRTLNFPTANFVPLEENQLLPKSGTYLTRGRVRGQLLYGMCNLGVRPTFGEGEYVMEVHFFDKNLDGIYDQTILIEFLERIRDEQKFPNKDALIAQLTRDRETCLQLLEKYRR